MDGVVLVDRIRRVAERQPTRPSVRSNGSSITFAELTALASAVSDRLHDEGVGPEDIVAVDAPRGTGSIVAAIGIWMCGAAYLPIDSRWPTRRREQVLSASDVVAVIEGAGPDGVGALLAGESALQISRPRGALDRVPQVAPSHPRNLAYVLHTSGSTGATNAVGVEIGAMNNYARYLLDLMDDPAIFTGDDMTVVLSANLCFDASLRPIHLLAAGATLVVTPDLATGSWQDQIDCITQNHATVLSGPPTWFSGLLGAGFRPEKSRVRLVFVGGEAVPNGLVREFRSAGCVVIVQYGPTETTIAATGGVLDNERFAEAPLGAPIPGVHVHLYGDDFVEAPNGERSMLFVSGAGIARGYLGNPRLTAERFVPDPTGPPGSRMFRTGDIARSGHGGTFSFLGREDDQVKLGAQRIELGGVAAVLNQHEAVAQSVLFVDRTTVRQRLVACYVARDPAADRDLNGLLRTYLAGDLPAFMVPAVIRRVKAIPVTAHGKVDVESLRQLVGADESRPVDAEDELDDVDRRLLAIFRATLGLGCGVEDDFFALGGGSLDALDVLARVRAEFGVRVRLREFFRDASVRTLRTLIEEAAG